MRDKRIQFLIILIIVVLYGTFSTGVVFAPSNQEIEADQTYAVQITSTPLPTAVLTSHIPAVDNPKQTDTEMAVNEQSISPVKDISIVIGSVGDIMCHQKQLEDARNTAVEPGQYTFFHWFEVIKPAIQFPDLMIGNLEMTLSGEELGYSGYPYFNAPDSILPAIKDAGFDVLLNSNNHIMDRRQQGLRSTIQAIDEVGLLHTGAWTNPDDFNTPFIVDVQGIRVGIVSATYSVNGLERYFTEEEKSYMVCYIDPVVMAERIKKTRDAGAEVIVVCPHWGDEYVKLPNRMIRETAQDYIRAGADIIFGHHPHVLQPVDEVEVLLDDGSQRKGLVFYSLGNFISNQYGVSKEAGAIAYVRVHKDGLTGQVTVGEAVYLPTWTYKTRDSTHGYYILPVGHVIDNPETIDYMDPSRSVFYRLDAVWKNTLSTLGTDAAWSIRSLQDVAIFTGIADEEAVENRYYEIH